MSKGYVNLDTGEIDIPGDMTESVEVRGRRSRSTLDRVNARRALLHTEKLIQASHGRPLFGTLTDPKVDDFMPFDILSAIRDQARSEGRVRPGVYVYEMDITNYPLVPGSLNLGIERAMRQTTGLVWTYDPSNAKSTTAIPFNIEEAMRKPRRLQARWTVDAPKDMLLDMANEAAVVNEIAGELRAERTLRFQRKLAEALEVPVRYLNSRELREVGKALTIASRYGQGPVGMSVGMGLLDEASIPVLPFRLDYTLSRKGAEFREPPGYIYAPYIPVYEDGHIIERRGESWFAPAGLNREGRREGVVTNFDPQVFEGNVPSGKGHLVTSLDRVIRIGSFERYAFPLIREAFPQLLARELISVQPTTRDVDSPIFNLRYTAGRPCLLVTRLDGPDEGRDWLSEHIDDTVTLLDRGSIELY